MNRALDEQTTRQAVNGHLTRRQREVLAAIADSLEARGYPPSIREIGEAVGLSSSSTVHSHLQTLERKGLIRRDPSKPRGITLLAERPNPLRDRVREFVAQWDGDEVCDVDVAAFVEDVRGLV